MQQKEESGRRGGRWTPAHRAEAKPKRGWTGAAHCSGIAMGRTALAVALQGNVTKCQRTLRFTGTVLCRRAFSYLFAFL